MQHAGDSVQSMGSALERVQLVSASICRKRSLPLTDFIEQYHKTYAILGCELDGKNPWRRILASSNL